MAYKNHDIIHSFAFLYVAFAHLTDGNIQKEEWQGIGARVYGWLKAFDHDVTGDGNIDGDDVVSIVFDTVGPYYDSMDNNGRISEFDRIIAMHKGQDWWTDKMSSGVVRDLEGLAMADGKMHENERAWLNAIAKQYGVAVTA